MKESKTKIESKLKNPEIIQVLKLNSWPAWVGLILWLALASQTIFSFQVIHWTTPQPAYILVLVISIIVALTSVQLKLSGWKSFLAFMIFGAIVTLWQTVSLFPAPPEFGLFKSIGFAFNAWNKALGSASPSENSIYFSLLLVLLTWTWGYFGTRDLLRRNRVWLTLIIGLIIIVVNLAFLNKSYYGYFYLYIFLSIIIISYTHLVKQYYHNGYFPRLGTHLPIWIATLVVLFGGLLLLIIIITPEMRSDQLRKLFESNVSQTNLPGNLKINIFRSVNSKDAVIKGTDQDVMQFNSRPNLSEEVQFLVTSSGVPNYWRIRRYDIYNSWGWSTSPVKDSISGSGVSQEANITPAQHNIISYSVVNKVKTDNVISSGKFLAANAPTILHSFEAQNPDITQNPDDNTAWVSTPHIYQPDDKYTATSQIIKPTIEQLKAASSIFPLGVVEQYLQLPANLPDSINRLGRSLVRGKVTEYDKLLAISNHLSTLKYILEGTYPPDNKDAVDDFLFVQKNGNCTNFASAAVVLLRGQGIPARFCTGYIPQQIDKSGNTFVVLAKDYHAWPEVYFPGCGWIEFEVTPGSISGNINDNNTGNNLPGLSGANIDEFPLFPTIPSNTNKEKTAKNPNSPSNNSHTTQNIIIISVLALLLSGFITLYIIWRKVTKRKDAISEIMARMHLISPLVGVSFQTSQTAEEYSDRLSSKIPQHRMQIEKLTQLFLVSRYSRGKLIIQENEKRLSQYWRVLFWGMIKRTIWRF